MQCNAMRLQCNTCSRLKTSVNSVHLAPRRTLFSGRCLSCASQRLQGFQDLQGSAQDKCVFCRGGSVFCRVRRREDLCVICRGGITLAGLRTSSTSVPGACRGLQSDVLLSCKNWIKEWPQKGKGLITQAFGVISFEDKIINIFGCVLSEHLY